MSFMCNALNKKSVHGMVPNANGLASPYSF